MPSMNRNSPYYAQVQLLIRLLPMVAAETCFALKGGTAINLFVRDFPRLSVDIDLVYLLSSNRAEALADIRTALDRLADAFSKVVPGIKIVRPFLHDLPPLGQVRRGQDGVGDSGICQRHGGNSLFLLSCCPYPNVVHNVQHSSEASSGHTAAP